MLQKLKKFWNNKLLGKARNPEDINDSKWSELNSIEKDMIMENIYIRVTELEEDNARLIQEISDMPAQCDKCFNYEGIDGVCIKCESIGVIQKSQLMGWPW